VERLRAPTCAIGEDGRPACEVITISPDKTLIAFFFLWQSQTRRLCLMERLLTSLIVLVRGTLAEHVVPLPRLLRIFP